MYNHKLPFFSFYCAKNPVCFRSGYLGMIYSKGKVILFPSSLRMSPTFFEGTIMKRTRINLDVLRASEPYARQHHSQPQAQELFNSPEAFSMSRRTLLKIGGVAAMSSVALARGSGSFVFGPFEVRGDAERVAFYYAGEERWVVDAKLYAGKPTLDLIRSDSNLVLKLSGARYPGTDIPADFVCEVKANLTTWTMNMAMAFGDFKATARFEEWLMNMAVLRSSLSLHDTVCQPDASHTLKLSGQAQMRFTPDNSVQLVGKDIASFSGLNINAHTLTIALAHRELQPSSLLKQPYSRRTRISMQRDGQEWNLGINAQPQTHWNIMHDSDMFDFLTLECAESAKGKKEYGALFETNTTDAIAAVQPLQVGNHHDEFILPLRTPKYAIAFHDTEEADCSFLARFGEAGVWLHQQGLSLQLQDSEQTPHFELHTKGNAISRVVCQPAMTKAMPHVGDAIVSPVDIETPTQLSFAGFGAVLAQIPSGLGAVKETVKYGGSKSKSVQAFSLDDLVEIKKSNKNGFQLAKIGATYIDVKVNVELPSISIIRPHDLLVLRFYYKNFQISTGGGSASLTPTNATQDGYIVVEFQPQNIFEQAFYETDPNLTATDSTSDSSQPETGDENPTQPPVKARISGPSRLAFKVAKGTSIPLTLDALLNWDNWEPSLVPVAQRKDKADSSSFKLYPGLLTYFGKQGMKFKAGAFSSVMGGSSAVKNITMEDFEAGLTTDSASKFKTSGIEYSSKYNTGYGIGKTSARTRTGISKTTGAGTGKSGISASGIKLGYSEIVNKYAGIAAMLAKPEIQKPEDTHTAIELPYRLFLSPLPDGGWAHSRKEKTRTLNLKVPDGSGGEKTESLNFTEMWHTRLWFRSKKKDGSYSVNERDGNYLLGNVPKVRAIWSHDYISPNSPPPTLFPDWRGSLTNADRWSIVMNSSNWYAKVGEKSYEPKAIDSNKLFLSAIGGWVDVHGAWDPVPSIVDLVDWIHRGTMGRDHYVRVMYRGYLFPFGHKCTLVKVTERKFNKPSKRGTYGAYLRQRMFIIVRQPDMALDDTNTLFKYQGREIPFKNIHIKTVVTPNISDPNGSDITGNGPYLSYGFPAAFEIKVPGGGGSSIHFMFQCSATDWDGNQIDFTMPLAFVLGSYSNTKPNDAVKIIDTWYKGKPSSYLMRKRPFDGARIAYGPSKNVGDTTFETDSIVFSADYPKKADGTTPNLPTDATWFYPTLEVSSIRHQDVEKMSGNNTKPDISYHSKFLEEGFDEAKNVGEVMMKFISQLPMNFGGAGGGSSDKSGGFIAPNQVLSGLSRAIGPISGAAGDISGALDKFTGASFNFDPSTFLSGIDAKIFGVISLMDIIQLITGSDPRTTLLPQLLSKAIPNLGTDPSALLNNLQNEVYNKLKSAYDDAYAEATSTASSILAKLQEMKDLLDGLKAQLDALATAISSASGTGDIFTILTDQLPEFLNWISTNLGPLGVIPADALTAIQEVSKFLENLQDGIRIGFDWKPKMQADPIGFFIPANPDDTFALSAYAKIPLSNNNHSLEIGEPEAKIEGYLQNFTINLIPVVMDIIAIPIIKMGFTADLGKKADIYCELGDLQFKGPLEFVNELQKYIPLNGFIDPPAIDVDASGIKISFDIAIPSVAIGLFSLTNISLGAALQLPFLGDSMLFKFEFCKKDSPFHMTYCMLGGGGYFGLTLSLEGVEKIEAAFEIGAELSVDFGVASGGISIFAGVYFCMEGDVITLTGYVKIHGEVDVLGLISASITLEMTLTYVSTGKLYGTATLTIEIEVFIFSGSVEISVEKYFKGSAGDPTIAQLMPDSLYPGSDKKYFDLYAGAFA